MSDDEYGSFPSLTDADLLAIDALSSPPLPTPPPAPAEPMFRAAVQKSLFDTFRRRRNALSVTDLVAPAWCEVQFDYGLRGKRWLPPALRPAKIETRDGKEIVVDRKLEVANDKVMRTGEAVHKTLEREIHPVQVEVRTTSAEEQMALRLLTMLDGLQALVIQNCTREFPVMGFLHNHYVVGIIDEIIRKPIDPPKLNPIPSTPKRTKSGKLDSPSSQQPSISSFFSPSPSPLKSKPAAPPPPPRTHTLFVRDHKTRVSATLPSEANAVSSRLQLMAYKTLLDPLLSRSPPFNFSELWARLGLNETRPFSDAFRKSARTLAGESDLNSLSDLQTTWRTALLSLGADQTSDKLELIYRLQPRHAKRRRRHTDTPAAERTPSPPALEGPLADSLAFVLGSMPGAYDGMSDRSFVADDMDVDADEQVLAMVLRDSLADASQEEVLGTVSGAEPSGEADMQHALRLSMGFVDAQPPPPPVPLDEVRVLGSHVFTHDAAVLDAHLTDVLQMWHGERPLRGVSIEQVDRCRACPYENGCEWREAKAAEFAARLSSNNTNNSSTTSF